MWNLINTYSVVGTVLGDVADTKVVASTSGSFLRSSRADLQGCKQCDISDAWWRLFREGKRGQEQGLHHEMS